MPYLLLTLAALFWGGNYVVGHILVQGADPIVMTEARWALTAMLLVGLYQRQIRESWRLLRGNASTLLILTLCGQVSFPLTLYIGLQTTSALNAAIYMSATPCMVLMINRLIFHDRVSARNWCGVAFSTAGVLLLLLHGNLTNAEGLKGFSQGDLWAMGSALSWAVYCSLLRNKDRRIPANAFVAVSSLIGALILLPVVIFWLWRHPATSFAAYHDISFLTAAIGATRGEIYTHLIPLSGGILSILFLHTRPHLYHLLSTLLILIGIAICSIAKKETVHS